MADDKWLDYVGLVGGFILSSMMLPQVWKVLRTKSARDLAWGFLCCYFVGLSMLCTYSWGKGLWSLYIPISLEMCMLIFQIVLKFKYDQRALDEAYEAKAQQPRPPSQTLNPFADLGTASPGKIVEQNPMFRQNEPS
mmetsp:Transcript_13954/g.23646  ORF Transcript_13954/g.23646 Transcript_13954/m.23646 type:complete len:137 (-) Transcript_13954:502-912(-)|eukprot:CAMPEP_0198219066 /NCGR_PEP_ID=MMETSP1445-20131203/72447_1 /TAXON_ID=36898 /ORGANISM="Pyramimonas sp., Strain CCMP2087" /LENGTH=136 /DNA_ID=CAMNT_0043896363 /DNA_START=284 /DNA_END=694 /DNA_ORIENTATION=-